MNAFTPDHTTGWLVRSARQKTRRMYQSFCAVREEQWRLCSNMKEARILRGEMTARREQLQVRP
jgi:hypothetical protein